MPGYYAYLIGVDGRFTKRVAIVCDDDEEAKRFARQLVDGHAIELCTKPARSRRSKRRNKAASLVGGTLIQLPIAYFSRFLVPIHLCGQTAQADSGPLSALPMFEMYLRSARRLRRAFRLVGPRARTAELRSPRRACDKGR